VIEVDATGFRTCEWKRPRLDAHLSDA